MPRQTYRPDIDGLRAVAVLAVILYHAAPRWLPGGFIGVDIFFVISGYLITGLLADAFTRQSFWPALLDFYQRRVRRLFPALLLVLVTTFVVGWLVLFPREYQALTQHVAASAAFVQNIALWSQAGYFDTDAIYKPLLHLWSLSVEEQFYILWPVALWLLMRLRVSLLAAVSAIALVSFAINLSLVYSHHEAMAFYWPVARTWELMVGAWLALGHRQGWPWLVRLGAAKSGAGVVLIAAGFVFIRPEYGFPGFWGLLPVIGTALVISASPNTLINRRLLSCRPMVQLGLISYPLYLWHWPILSLATIILGITPGPAASALNLTLVCVLAYPLASLTYHGLEKPLRRGRGRIGTGLVTGMAGMGVAAMVVYALGGAPGRMFRLYTDQGAAYVASIKQSPQLAACYQNELHMLGDLDSAGDQWYCTLGDPDAKRWIIAYGDSHAASLIPALDHYGQTHGVRVVLASMARCLALKDVRTHLAWDAGCRAMTRRVHALVGGQHPPSVAVIIEHWIAYISGLDWLGRKWPIVTTVSVANEKSVVRARLTLLRRGLTDTLAFYQAMGVPVLVLEDSPQQRDFRSNLSRLRFDGQITQQSLDGTAVTRTQHEDAQRQVNRVLRSVAFNSPHVTTLSVTVALCGREVCSWARAGQFMYFDEDHLTVFGAMQVYPVLADALNGLLHP